MCCFIYVLKRSNTLLNAKTCLEPLKRSMMKVCENCKQYLAVNYFLLSYTFDRFVNAPLQWVSLKELSLLVLTQRFSCNFQNTEKLHSQHNDQWLRQVVDRLCSLICKSGSQLSVLGSNFSRKYLVYCVTTSNMEIAYKNVYETNVAESSITLFKWKRSTVWLLSGNSF